MITPEQATRLLKRLDAQITNAYASGDRDKGDKLDDMYNALEAWLDDGMSGPPPVDLDSLRQELDDADMELTEIAGDDGSKNVKDVLSAPLPSLPEPESQSRDEDHTAEELSELTRLRREARRAEKEGDIERANELWRRVIALDPEDADAKRKLQRHSAALADEAVRRKLTELHKKAGSELISDLERALQLAREILSMPNLDEETQKTVQDLESTARDKRAQIKAEAGEIETAAGLGELREAIAQMEDYIKKGRYEFEDRDGNIVVAADKLNEYNVEYAAFCTQKAGEYLERAEQSLPAYPKAADEVLSYALEEFDKADAGIRDQLQRRRAEVRELITRWERAQALIEQASKERDPQERLSLLETAYSLYKDVEGLEALLADAKRDAAAAIVHDITNIFRTAELFFAKGDLDGAHREAMRARERAKEMRGASEELDAVLVQVDALMDDISQAASVAHLAEQVKEQVDRHLQAHDYISAMELIEGLDDDVRQHPAIKTLESQIVRAQGADAILRKAQQRFDEADYIGVLDLLDIESEAETREEERIRNDLRRDPRTAELRRQATARQAFFEGVELMSEDPAAAKQQFELAQMNDPELAGQIEPYLQQIAAWEQRKGDVENLLQEAAKLKENGQWGEAYKLLDEAKEIDSPLKQNALEEWAQVRKRWKEVLLAELDQVAADSDRAREIMATLRDEGLLDDPEEQERVHQARLTFHRLRARKAANDMIPRWEEAAEEWKIYLSFKPDDKEAQAALREALRQAALNKANKLYTSTRDPAQALELLEKRLQDPYLEADPLFLAELVRLACQFEDFETAQRYLDVLRFRAEEDSPLVTDARQLLLESQMWADARASSDVSFKEGRFAVAVRLLDDVIEAYPNSDNRQEWEAEREKVRRRAVAALLDKARQKKRNASGRELIEVISLYSQVIRLVGKGENREAEEGIKEVRSELPALVRSVVQEAQSFSPENRDPDDAYLEAEGILDKLSDFRAIVSYMGEEQARYQRSIDEAIRKLSRQRDQVRRVADWLRDVRKAVKEPSSDRVVSEAMRKLKQAKQELPRAVGINELEAGLTEISKERQEIRQYILQLQEAVRNEQDPDSFQQVIAAVRGVRQLDPENKYQLLSPQSLDVYYDFLDEHINTLEGHDQLARRRQENYRLYIEWERKCAPQYEAFEAVMKDVESKRRSGSLDAQIETLDRALAVAKRALAVFDERPKPEPLSFPDEDIVAEISEWEERVRMAKDELEDELKRVEKKRERLMELDRELTTILNRRPVTSNKNIADRLLQEIRQIDPHWDLLPRREQRVRVWRESRQGILGRLRR